MLIDYGNIRGGILYHGTISNLDGRVRSTWTYEKSRRKVTLDQQIDEKTFEVLCKGINQYAVFQKYQVRDPATRIDPSKCHVVMFMRDANQRTFLIPVGETDPDFARWLGALNVPKGD